MSLDNSIRKMSGALSLNLQNTGKLYVVHVYVQNMRILKYVLITEVWSYSLLPDKHVLYTHVTAEIRQFWVNS